MDPNTPGKPIDSGVLEAHVRTKHVVIESCPGYRREMYSCKVLDLEERVS